MQELFTYLLKSSGLIAAFFLSYHFLLRKETFFTSNRWFLLAGLITSVTLPLYFIKRIIFVERPKIIPYSLPEQATQSTVAIQDIPPIIAPFDWIQFIGVCYAIVAGVLVIKILINLILLFRMFYRLKINKLEQFKLVDFSKNTAPFSFFNFIVYNSELYSKSELQSILSHEKIHSREKHSVDVLFSELFCALFWINPFIWLYKKAIVQNLEYIADQKAIGQLDDKISYQHALLKVVSHQNCLPITNNFYQSLIKKRIVMLNKNQSNKKNSWKYVTIIPALIAFVFLFQVKIMAQEKAAIEDNRFMEIHEGISITFDANETDKSLKTLKNVFEQEKIIVDISKIKRNSNGEITGIYIKMESEDGRNSELEINQKNPINTILLHTNRLENGSYAFKVEHVTNGKLDSNGNVVQNSENATLTATENKERSTAYVFDKISSDNEFKETVEELRNDFNIDFKATDIKRNPVGEIIKIKLSFNDNKGNKGTTQQDRTIPIRPIFFKVTQMPDGKTKIGFYDNPDMIQKPFDGVKENKITTIESIKNDALIYVDGQRYDKATLNELDVKGLEKIEVLTDAKSLQKYGAKEKNEVYVITTNWTTRDPKLVAKLESPSIFTLQNGDEVVLFDRNSMKIPRYPVVKFTDTYPILIYNGKQQQNPRLTIESIDLTKIKTIKMLNEKDEEVIGAPIYKMIISTK